MEAALANQRDILEIAKKKSKAKEELRVLEKKVKEAKEALIKIEQDIKIKARKKQLKKEYKDGQNQGSSE